MRIAAKIAAAGFMAAAMIGSGAGAAFAGGGEYEENHEQNYEQNYEYEESEATGVVQCVDGQVAEGILALNLGLELLNYCEAESDSGDSSYED